MPSPIITLTTDFGLDSLYTAQIKGVILSLQPRATVVDATHAIAPQDIRQGALALEAITPRFPRGSIHIAVIDPGVGTDRQILAAEIDGRYYVAPDNGLLSRLLAADRGARVVVLNRPAHWLPAVSATFHGRDIMAPVAARLSLGTPLDELGDVCDRMVQLTWRSPTVEGHRVLGEIIGIDSFGNLITNIHRNLVAVAGPRDRVTIQCGGRTLSGLVDAYGHGEPGALVGVIGSGDHLEIAVVNGSAARALRAEVGDRVSVAGPA